MQRAVSDLRSLLLPASRAKHRLSWSTEAVVGAMFPGEVPSRASVTDCVTRLRNLAALACTNLEGAVLASALYAELRRMPRAVCTMADALRNYVFFRVPYPRVLSDVQLAAAAERAFCFVIDAELEEQHRACRCRRHRHRCSAGTRLRSWG